MYPRTVAVLAGLALAAATPAATSAASPMARAACTNATIGGQSKCLAAGQFCAHSKASQYRRYGFKCVKRNGRYRLTH